MGTINYKIPDDLHKDVKVECARQGISLKEFLIESLKEKLKVSKK